MNTVFMPANYPWLPGSWVGGGRIRKLQDMRDDSSIKYAAVKATSAIMRAMRK